MILKFCFAGARASLKDLLNIGCRRRLTRTMLQEVYLAAYEGFGRLSDKSNFKSWLIGIARNKCNDYYRGQAKASEIPLDEISESVFAAAE